MVIDKNNIKFILLILVLGLGIGYAYINSDLNINGTAQVNSANWDVHWANIQVTNGSVSASSPTISNQTTVNYSITLNQPGDYYEFTVDAVNGGSIDAMIDTIDSKLNGSTITTLPAYLKYSVTYSSGTPLEPNHELLHNTTEKYKVRIEYNAEVNQNQLPTTNQTLNLQFTVTYRQANENATEVDHFTRYTANVWDTSIPTRNYLRMGQPIPNNITLHTTMESAIAELRQTANDDEIQYCLKHKVENDVITESYVTFIVTNDMASSNPGMNPGIYSIRGAVQEHNSSEKPTFNDNLQILYNAFDSNRCSLNTSIYFAYCEVDGLEINLDHLGNVTAEGGNLPCSVFSSGESICGYAD